MSLQGDVFLMDSEMLCIPFDCMWKVILFIYWQQCSAHQNHNFSFRKINISWQKMKILDICSHTSKRSSNHKDGKDCWLDSCTEDTYWNHPQGGLSQKVVAERAGSSRAVSTTYSWNADWNWQKTVHKKKEWLCPWEDC